MFIPLALLVAAAAQQPAVAPLQKSDPVVCKRDATPEVGTHMRPKPVCMKKSDWDLVEKNTQNQLTHLQDRSSFDPGMAQGAGRPQ